MKQRPVAIGLLLCEQVIVEERTRNITPVNCFTQRAAERFPSDPFPFVVFAIMTDGLGEMPMAIVIYRLDTLEEVYRAEQSIHFTGPLQSVRCKLAVRDCSFPEAGHYEAVLFVDGEPIAQRKFAVFLKENIS
jgi:hypothetical protein